MTLEPCPFCGHVPNPADIVYPAGGFVRVAVRCPECGATGPAQKLDPSSTRTFSQAEDEALRLWNQRKGSEST